MRKLATIRRISEIRPIANADAIECAVVDGWTVVIRKGEYQQGDLAIYCEVDAWIPTELAPFLSKGQEPREYNGVRGERLKTVKLRGQLSQGLLLCVHDDPSGVYVHKSNYDGEEFTLDVKEGDDVSAFLGIQKYEPPVPAQLAGVVKGPFPAQVPKTDEERIQNLTNEWPQYSLMTYEVTEKLEGSSMTVGMLGNEFIVCSRNLNLKESEGNTLWAVARKYDIENKMRACGYHDLVLQGELVGEGVQGNHYQLKGQDFYVFAIYDILRGEYVDPVNRKIMVNQLGLKHVPVVHEAFDMTGITVEEVLVIANGHSQLRNQVLREGLVFKQLHGQTHWKAVSNDYLLKHG
jgi:RNA ligase (TIGR02306 family)